MNVLVILGHPRKDSLCAALCAAYREGARAAGANVETVVLADLAFDPYVRVESPEQQPLEPDLEIARQLIEWADHLVFVHPTWWGCEPALLKGFLERMIMPGFAFRFDAPDSTTWRRLWRGKTSQIITTMDTPPPLYRWFYLQPGHNALARATLGFCGVRRKRGLRFGPVRLSSLPQRRRWIERTRQMAFATCADRSGPRWRLAGWLRALRLQFYPMGWAAYAVGALAFAGGSAFASAIFWWGLLCLFALQVAAVFTNEYFDFESDRRNAASGPFTGGSRALVDGRLDFAELRAGIAATVTAALVFAVFAIRLAPRPGEAIALLAIAFVLTLGYTAPPLKLCHRGLGEVDVAITHGFLTVLAGWLLQGGSAQTPTPWLLALPLGTAVLPAIILSGLPDRAADAAAGKRTLAVRLGARPAIWLALVLAVVAAALAIGIAHVPAAHFANRNIMWGVVPWAGLLVLALLALLRKRRDAADARIDGVMMLALAYMLWFVAVPIWNLS